MKRLVIMEPSTATPMVPPIERKNEMLAVTWPSLENGKAFCTTMVNRLITIPRPRPVTIMFRIRSESVALTSICDNRNMPTAVTLKPTSASAL